MDDAELVRQLRGGINGMRITVLGNVQHGEACLEAADRIEALIAERDAARDAALEDAAKVAEGDKCRTFGDAHRLAAAIRALKGKSQ